MLYIQVSVLWIYRLYGIPMWARLFYLQHTLSHFFFYPSVNIIRLLSWSIYYIHLFLTSVLFPNILLVRLLSHLGYINSQGGITVLWVLNSAILCLLSDRCSFPFDALQDNGDSILMISIPLRLFGFSLKAGGSGRSSFFETLIQQLYVISFLLCFRWVGVGET